MININYQEVQEELKKKNLYNIQKELTIQRRARTVLMSMLLFSLVFTITFGMLEDPVINTLSNIGNFYTYRLLFIIWAVVSGISIQVTLIALFQLEKYPPKYASIFVYLATIFLVATGVIPALKDEFPILHIIHVATSVLYGVCLYIALFPFTKWISKENPRLRINVLIWQIVIWAGALVFVSLYWISGVFELWFFTANLVFLLYLSMVLFEEKIIKISVKLLMDEDNLNIAIEKIFVNLENKNKRLDKEKERK